MFKSVKTVWGVMHLHVSGKVWYVKEKDWKCYHTSRDFPSNKPWTQDAICMGTGKRKEMVSLCEKRVNLMSSIRNRTFAYS